MPKGTIESPPPADWYDIAAGDESCVPCARPDPDEAKGGDSGRPSHNRIANAVQQVRLHNILNPNDRRQQRAAFMLPAVVSFSRPRVQGWHHPPDERQGEVEVSWDVVTTDFSPIGAGILSYSNDEALPPRVTLVIGDSAFDCEVRWATRIGHRVYRYGLLFVDVHDASVSPGIG